MNGCVGRRILFGIRPEHVAVKADASAAPLERTTEAVVETVEPRGAETYLHLTRGTQSLVARVGAAERFRPGQNVSLVFEMSHAHFFDPATANRSFNGD